MGSGTMIQGDHLPKPVQAYSHHDNVPHCYSSLTVIKTGAFVLMVGRWSCASRQP
jgi:hypothetical protein